MMSLLHSALLYIIVPWLYFTILDPTLFYHGFTSRYFSLLPSNVGLLHSIHAVALHYSTIK